MFGKTIQYIRTSKKMSQSSVARASNINQSTYSKFENTQIDLRGATLFEILNVLDISLHEFYYIHNKNSHSKKESILFEFFNSPYNNEMSLRQMQSKCMNLMESNEDSRIIKEVSLLCEALLLILKEDNFELAKFIVQPIWDRLSNHNELFLYDIYLFNSILFLFNLDEILEIKKFVERSIEKYISFPNMVRVYINLNLNIGLICIINKKYALGNDIIEAIIQKAKDEKVYLQLAIAYIRKGICSKGQFNIDGDIWMDKGFAILESIEEYETLEFMKKEIATYLIK